MIRILHIVGAMYPGGMENFIMNLYEKIDRERFQFDFAVHKRKDNDYGELIESMGGHIYELPRLTRHPVKSLLTLYRLVKKNRYPLVIRHTANALVSPQLLVAKLAGAKTICHSHTETDAQMLPHKLGKLLMPLVTTDRMACSPKAAKWMFGNASFTEVHNAIDLEKFSYSQEKAEKIEQEFVLNKCHVYGHIGNFVASKNHLFMIDIFAEIKKIDPTAKFFFLGEGDMRPAIEAKRKELGLDDSLILTGIRKDVADFMSRMNVLLFPSVYEGLPLTLIEAQIAALPMLISDTITKEVVVTEGFVHWEKLQTPASEWAKQAVKLACTENNRVCQEESITKAGYNIKSLVAFYEAYFAKLEDRK